MITRSMGAEGLEDMAHKRIVLETLETKDDQVTMRLNNSLREKKMRLRVYNAQISNQEFSGSPIHLVDLAVQYSKQVYSTREYVCDRVVLENQHGEQLVITQGYAPEDQKAAGGGDS